MKKSNTKVVNNMVKELRKQKKLTQAEFAEKLDDVDFSISPDAISKIERGDMNLSPDIAMRICKTFNVTLDWLYKRTDEPLDAPSTILESLKSMFRLVPKEITVDLRDEYLTYTYLNLLISPALDKYLHSITNAERLWKLNEIPQSGYEHWLKGARQEFNETFNNGEKVEPIKYIVLPVSDISEEMIRVIEEEKYAERKKQKKDDTEVPQ